MFTGRRARRVLTVCAGVALTALVAGCTTASDRSAAPGAGRSGLTRGAGPRGAAGSTESHEVRHDTSRPLRSIRPLAAAGLRREESGDKRDEILPHPKGGAVGAVEQRSVQGLSVARQSPTVGPGFDGVGSGFTGPGGTFTVNSAPPDTNSAVGPNHIVTVVNTAFAVQTKTGSVLYGPAATNTVFSGFGGACQSTNDGDGVVRYDRLADRWVITQFANAASASGPYYECIAVSTSPDPTGSWNRYSFQYANFPDYPKLGVWPDAYYVTYNQFSGNSFRGALACAMDRAKMLAGQAATQQCFSTSTSYGGLLPSDLDGATPPPAGASNVVVGLGTTSTTLASWSFHVDWASPASSTFTGPTGLTVASYSPACNGGTCIPQPSTSTKLDSLADRLMYRLAYRNFGDHQSLLVSHAVTTTSSTGVRWYELRLSGSTPSVYQQGTYAPDASYRWMSSAAMDKVGNIGIGYSVSSTSLAPSIRVSGRLAGDALGLLTQGETTIVTGSGSQTGGLTRWGDYATMSVDPSDDCTLWFSSEYLPASGSFNWRTRTGSFQLPGCATPVTDDFSVAVVPTSGAVTTGGSTQATVSTTTTQGTSQSVTFSAAGVPAGATAAFLPASVTSGASSTLTLATSSNTSPGTYAVTITATGATATHTGVYTLTVNAPVIPGIVNGGFETGTLSGWTASGTESVLAGSARTGTYADRGGSTSPTKGDSKAQQTFTVPLGATKVSFWYVVTCPDTVKYDWATATLKDVAAGTTKTILGKTCTNGAGWKQVTASVTAGKTYTLTLTSHDDNYATDPTYTRFDDVSFS